jgi:hypothetical protein
MTINNELRECFICGTQEGQLYDFGLPLVNGGTARQTACKKHARGLILAMDAYVKAQQAEEKQIIVEYVNIDERNRAVFKDINKKEYYGATDITFPYDEAESEVKKKVTEKDLTYFGNSFNCEPMGTEASNIVIIWRV